MQGSFINNTTNDTDTDPNEDKLEDTITEAMNKNEKLKAATQ